MTRNRAGGTASSSPAAGPRRFGWRSGLGFYLGVQAASYGLGLIARRARHLSEPTPGELIVGNEAYNDYYNSLRQPVFAPPDWVFAPVWTVNNVMQIWGLLHTLNQDQDTPGRTAFLALQGGFWASFVAFNPLYFGLRSPILGATTTQAGLGLAVASAAVAAFQMKDRKAVASLSTVLPWLVLAAATSGAIALWNRDDFLAVGPFASPPPGWAKPLPAPHDAGTASPEAGVVPGGAPVSVQNAA